MCMDQRNICTFVLDFEISTESWMNVLSSILHTNTMNTNSETSTNISLQQVPSHAIFKVLQ